jgi:hypothetical protein
MVISNKESSVFEMAIWKASPQEGLQVLFAIWVHAVSSALPTKYRMWVRCAPCTVCTVQYGDNITGPVRQLNFFGRFLQLTAEHTDHGDAKLVCLQHFISTCDENRSTVRNYSIASSLRDLNVRLEKCACETESVFPYDHGKITWPSHSQSVVNVL